MLNNIKKLLLALALATTLAPATISFARDTIVDPGAVAPRKLVKHFVKSVATVLNVSESRIRREPLNSHRVLSDPLQYELITSYAPGDIRHGFYTCIGLYTIRDGEIYTNRFNCGWNSPSGVEVGSW